MPYFVYILLSKKDHKLYVGCTKDLEKRFERHKNGNVEATKNRLPLELIYSERIENETDAFNRERFFKSLWSSRLKKKIVEQYKQNRACH